MAEQELVIEEAQREDAASLARLLAVSYTHLDVYKRQTKGSKTRNQLVQVILQGCHFVNVKRATGSLLTVSYTHLLSSKTLKG